MSTVTNRQPSKYGEPAALPWDWKDERDVNAELHEVDGD